MEDYYDREVQEFIANMHPELIKENILDQINAGIISPYKENYLKDYMMQYKYFKNMYGDNEDISRILDNSLENTLTMIIQSICEKFDFEMNLDDIKLKPIAKALYKFFVLKYDKNIINFFTNFIISNKKELVSIIKQEANKSKVKKCKNVTTIANKLLYGNNESLLISNINYIILEIIPSWGLDVDFLDYFDSTLILDTLKQYLNNEMMVVFNDNIFDKFIEPIVDKEPGYNSIISEVTVNLTSIYNKKEKINILSNDEEGDDE